MFFSEILDKDILPYFVFKEMRSWLLRCSKCLQLRPKDLHTYEVFRIRLNEFSVDTYSGPESLSVETNFCSKCC